jgi:Tfp pilus assembly protein PilF
MNWSTTTSKIKNALQHMAASKLLLVAVAILAIGSMFFWSTNDAVYIDPFTIPPAIAKTGLTSEGLAAQVGDMLSKLETATRTNLTKDHLVIPEDVPFVPDIQIPDTGISIRAIGGIFQSFLATHVTAVVVLAAAGGDSPNVETTIFVRRRGKPASITLKQRVANIDAISAAELGSLVKGTAKDILLQINPLLFAACLATNSQIDSAIELARSQVAIHAADKHIAAAAYEIWGDALQEYLRYDDALTIYKKAEALDSRDSAIHNNLGAVYVSMATNESPAGTASSDQKGTLFGNAIAEFKLAIEADSKNAAAYRNWGVALFNQHDFQDAIKMDERAIELAPDEPASYDDLANALELTKPDGWRQLATDARDKAQALRAIKPKMDVIGDVCKLDTSQE